MAKQITLEIEAKNDPFTTSTHYTFDAEGTKMDLLMQVSDMIDEVMYHHVLIPTESHSLHQVTPRSPVLILPEDKRALHQVMKQVVKYLDQCIEMLEVREVSN